MKKLFTILLLIVSFCSKGQIKAMYDTTKWEPIDTFERAYSLSPLWVEDPVWHNLSNSSDLDTQIVKMFQMRIGQKSGILQKRVKTVKVFFVSPVLPKSLFDTIIDSLSK